MLPSLVLCRRDAQPGAADWGYMMPYLAIKNATTPSHSSSVGLGVGSYGLVGQTAVPIASRHAVPSDQRGLESVES